MQRPVSTLGAPYHQRVMGPVLLLDIAAMRIVSHYHLAGVQGAPG